MAASVCYTINMSKYRPWLVLAAVLLFVVGGVSVASYFLRGYQVNWRRGLFEPTGLLVANSDPKGASVFINGKLATASDDTLNLPPGEYQVRISKDGYLPWQKKILIKKEVVKQTDAYLFRSAPDLKPLTFVGALNPQLSPDGGRVVYAVASASAQEKNGLWVNSLARSPLDIIRNNSRQIARRGEQRHWENARLVWSPDSRQVLAYFITGGKISAAYLLPADRFLPADQLRDVSLQLPLIYQQWQSEKSRREQEQIANLPKQLRQIASQSAQLVTFSPDGERFFYLATAAAAITPNLRPHPPARSDQPEKRQLEPGHAYDYNLKEDTNFDLGAAADLGIDLRRLKPGKTLAEKLARINYQPLRWLATSRHIIFLSKHRVMVVEADGQNREVLFAGPFRNSFAYPWPDGEKLLVLTALYTGRPANLYAVRIK